MDSLEVPEELKTIILKSFALYELRDKLIHIPFSYNKLKRVSIEAYNIRNRFWIEIMQLYPEHKNRMKKYDVETNTIILEDK